MIDIITPSGEGICNNITLTGGIVLSPNFPNNYESNTLIIYTIEVSSNRIIQLDFDVFAIYSTPGSSVYVSKPNWGDRGKLVYGVHC